MNNAGNNIFERALDCLLLDDPQQKVEATLALHTSQLAGELSFQALSAVKKIAVPGRPAKPVLVDPREVPRRGFSSVKARLALAHAIAHIEFNAINLALDAVYRFQQMPEQYYADWCRVAAEEARHYSMLADYLGDYSMHYGDQNAHNGLWEMAVKTDFDVMARMALVPRVLEARGLDVTPTMIKKLQAVGDTKLVSTLQVIFDEEVGHVKIGSYWYTRICEERKLEPRQTFIELIEKHMQGAKFGPFETSARLQAGFTREEMQSLMSHF